MRSLELFKAQGFLADNQLIQLIGIWSHVEALKLLICQDHSKFPLLISGLLCSWEYSLETLCNLYYHLVDLLWNFWVTHHDHRWLATYFYKLNLKCVAVLWVSYCSY